MASRSVVRSGFGSILLAVLVFLTAYNLHQDAQRNARDISVLKQVQMTTADTLKELRAAVAATPESIDLLIAQFEADIAALHKALREDSGTVTFTRTHTEHNHHHHHHHHVVCRLPNGEPCP